MPNAALPAAPTRSATWPQQQLLSATQEWLLWQQAIEREGPALLAPDLPMSGLSMSDPPMPDASVPAPEMPVPEEIPAPGIPETVSAGARCPLAEVEGFIARWIAGRCGLKPGAVSPETEFAMLGLGSIDSGELSIDLSRRFDLDLDPTVFWNYPSIRELAGFVHGEVMTPRPS